MLIMEIMFLKNYHYHTTKKEKKEDCVQENKIQQIIQNNTKLDIQRNEFYKNINTYIIFL